VRPVEIRGTDRLRKRLDALGALKDLQPALRAEAEAVAEEAKARLTERDPNSRLARSIKIMGLGAEDQPAYAVGTDDQAGFFLEFGTSRMRASPWLVPALHSRLPAINQAVRKVIAAALKAAAKA
jgi:HK97 gp10 family phage protein